MTSRGFVFLGAALLFCSGASVGRTQVTPAKAPRSESDSLGDAARKARPEATFRKAGQGLHQR